MAGVAMTGGTPAMRQAAAQRAVGPRVVGQRAQRMTASRPATASRAQRTAAKPVSRPMTATATGAKLNKPVAFNPVNGILNTQQLGQLANQITRQNMRSELAPLRQQAQEIQGTEGTVANRYAGYSSATSQLLQGIGQDAAAQAKTYENRAADAALKTSEALNQTGKTAEAQNGGSLDSQAQAELNAQGKVAAGVGGAQNSFAANAGQNEQGFMANLRAAAAQRALEGQRGIATAYGGQLAKNEGQQQALIAKQPADAKSLAVELGQKQFTDYATAQGLGIKQQTAQQGEQKIKLTERGQNITAARDAAHARLEERKISETERHNRASETTAAEKAKAEMKKANGGLSTSAQDKIASQIGTAYNIVQQLRTANIDPQEIRNTLTNGNLRRVIETESSTGKKGSKEVTYKYPKIGDQTLITAAFELWDYHKVSSQTAQALKGMGVPVPANWTNGTFSGF